MKRPSRLLQLTARLLLMCLLICTSGTVLAAGLGSLIPASPQLAYAGLYASSLYLLDVQRGVETLLVPTGAEIYNFAWSPDGQYLAFAQGENIYIKSLESAEAWLLLEQISSVGLLEWSPDGQYLAFESTGLGTLGTFVVDMQCRGQSPRCSPEPRLVNPGRDGSWYYKFLTWSPDSQYLLVANDRGTYVLDSEGQQPYMITPLKSYQAAWQANAAVLLVYRGRGSTRGELYTVTTACLAHPDQCSEGPRRVGQSTYQIQDFMPAADGQSLYFIDSSDTVSQIFSIDTACFATNTVCNPSVRPLVETLPNTAPKYTAYRWSADGQQLQVARSNVDRSLADKIILEVGGQRFEFEAERPVGLLRWRPSPLVTG